MSIRQYSRQKLTNNRYNISNLDLRPEFLLKVASGPTFTDVGKNGFTVSAFNSPTASTNPAKFSGTSLGLNGTSQYLTVPDNAAWDYGTASFTVEAWVYSNSVSGNRVVVSNYGGAGSWWMRSSGTDYQFGSSDTTLISRSGAGTATWTHLAVSREGTNLRLFKDGVQQGATVTDSTSLTGSTSTLFIGCLTSGIGQFYSGNIQDLRISKTARYTANFTPPDSLV